MEAECEVLLSRVIVCQDVVRNGLVSKLDYVSVGQPVGRSVKQSSHSYALFQASVAV